MFGGFSDKSREVIIQATTLKCGDVIEIGDHSYIIREYVDGKEKTKYSGVRSR